MVAYRGSTAVGNKMFTIIPIGKIKYIYCTVVVVIGTMGICN